MSLRSFHLLFITLSVVLTAFVAVWATGQYVAGHDLSYAAAVVTSVAGGAALAMYGAAFRRKTRNL